MKFSLLVCDPPWAFVDKLVMDDVARGAAANYQVMSNQDIKNLKVKHLVDPSGAVMALWVPSSLLTLGLEVLQGWGFKHVQTWIWVKTKKKPQQMLMDLVKNQNKSDLSKSLEHFDFNQILGFGMGRLFRQCHEVVLVGICGKPYPNLKNKSQRSVFFHPSTKHSVKPEALQDQLELMFPSYSNKIELFARRQRQDWLCLGNEAPLSIKEDIYISIDKSIKISNTDLTQILSDTQNLNNLKIWQNL